MEQKPKHVLAPELEVSRWFNTNEPLTLGALRGRPVLLHTFQMLCPGCVVHAIPQAQKIHGMLRNTDLAVVGLHTVFEHHEAMTPVSLEAFIHEYRITFPVGVDMASEFGTDPEDDGGLRTARHTINGSHRPARLHPPSWLRTGGRRRLGLQTWFAAGGTTGGTRDSGRQARSDRLRRRWMFHFGLSAEDAARPRTTAVRAHQACRATCKQRCEHVTARRFRRPRSSRSVFDRRPGPCGRSRR